jgi:outer membrane protein OmpA-like peptidoglycan-associated protein
VSVTKRFLRNVAVVVTAVILAACGSAPPPPELVDARAAYAKAQNGPAASVAPAQLHEAKTALDSAESAFSDAPDAPKTRDLAYVAQRKAQWADAQGGTAQAIATRDKALADANKLTSAGLAQARGELSRTKQALNMTAEQLAAEKKAREAAEKRMRDALDRLAVAGALSIKEEPRGTVIVLPGSVLFQSAKWDLLPTAQEKLNAVADALKNQQDESKIVVEGHTDSQGSESSNLELGTKRALTVKDYLVSRGVKSDHISSIGIGQSRPIADNRSPEGRANNRRVEIIITPIERR